MALSPAGHRAPLLRTPPTHVNVLQTLEDVAGCLRGTAFAVPHPLLLHQFLVPLPGVDGLLLPPEVTARVQVVDARHDEVLHGQATLDGAFDQICGEGGGEEPTGTGMEGSHLLSPKGVLGGTSTWNCGTVTRSRAPGWEGVSILDQMKPEPPLWGTPVVQGLGHRPLMARHYELAEAAAGGVLSKSPRCSFISSCVLRVVQVEMHTCCQCSVSPWVPSGPGQTGSQRGMPELSSLT